MSNSFKDVVKNMINFVSECGDDVEIYSIINASNKSKKDDIGRYGWKLKSLSKNKEEDFIVGIETLKNDNGEELDRISYYLTDPVHFLSILKQRITSSIEDDIDTLLKEELRFLAKIDHLKTID